MNANEVVGVDKTKQAINRPLSNPKKDFQRQIKKLLVA
jgi:hypothetical protein